MNQNIETSEAKNEGKIASDWRSRIAEMSESEIADELARYAATLVAMRANHASVVSFTGSGGEVTALEMSGVIMRIGGLARALEGWLQTSIAVAPAVAREPIARRRRSRNAGSVLQTIDANGTNAAVLEDLPPQQVSPERRKPTVVPDAPATVKVVRPNPELTRPDWRPPVATMSDAELAGDLARFESLLRAMIADGMRIAPLDRTLKHVATVTELEVRIAELRKAQQDRLAQALPVGTETACRSQPGCARVKRRSRPPLIASLAQALESSRLADELFRRHSSRGSRAPLVATLGAALDSMEIAKAFLAPERARGVLVTRRC